MRQRKIKNVEEKIAEYSYMIALEPEAIKGFWRDFFEGEQFDKNEFDKSSKKLLVEVGCGKGDFIKSIAAENPDCNYIAIEGLSSVILRALSKIHEAELKNVRFIDRYVRDMRIFFDGEELDGIFLNFSDPWPKQRNAKRRLTYGERLIQYSDVLKHGGFIRFKTDNRELFDFSVNEMKKSCEETGLEVSFISYDLRNGRDARTEVYAKGSPLTEYESKFMAQGKPICFIELIKK